MFGRLTLIAFVALFALAAPVSAQAPGAARPAEEDTSSTNRTVFPASLAGRWTSAPLELALTSEFHQSVYGAGASSVRSVAMTIQPSGEGVFTVTSRVRDRRGRVVPGTQEIEEVRFSVGDLVEQPGRQPHYTSRIVKAERRFADDPSSAFARDGVTLALYVPEGKPGTLEVRFDTPEGTGSFWETVRRTAARAGAQPPS
jgi:hypothetical protein